MKRSFLLFIIALSFKTSFSQCDSVRIGIKQIIRESYDTSFERTMTYYSTTGKILSFTKFSTPYNSPYPLRMTEYLEYAYDQNDSLIYELRQTGNATGAINDYRYYYSFDVNGNLLSSVFQDWLSNTWTTVSADSFAYDVSGSLISQTHFNSQGPSTKKLYFYNISDTTEVYQTWVNPAWENTAMSQRKFDISGNPSLHYLFGWNGTSWDTTEQTMFIYSNGLLDSIYIREYSSGWVDSRLTTFSYHNTTSLFDTVLVQVFDTAWALETMSIYKYNTLSQLLDTLISIFPDALNNTMLIYEYGALNKVTLTTILRWDGSGWRYEVRFITDVDQNGYPSFQDEQEAYDDGSGNVTWSSMSGPENFSYDQYGNILSNYGHNIPGGPWYTNYNYQNGMLVSINSHSETMGGIPTDSETIYYYAHAYGDSLICLGDSSTLEINACPGFQYVWNTGETGNSIIVDSSGVYYVQVIHPNGYISHSQPITVYVEDSPPFIISGNDSMITRCANNYVQLHTPAQQHVLYQWYRNDTALTAYTSSSAFFYSNNLTSGEHYLVAKNICGTDTSAVSTFNILPAITGSITADGPVKFCKGDSVTLTANPGFSYLWNTGDTSQSITTGIQNSYSVTLRDTSGCYLILNQSVGVYNVIPPFSIYPSGTDLLTNYPSTNRQWFLNGDTIPGATLATYTPSQAGYYSLALSNYYNCVTYSDSLYFDPTIVMAYAGPDRYICTGLTTHIGTQYAAYGGTPPYSYEWLPAGIAVYGTQPQTSTYAITADVDMVLKVTDAMGAIATDTVHIIATQPISPPLTTNFGTTFCSNNYNAIRLNIPGITVKNWYYNGDSTANTNIYYQVTHSGTYQLKFIDQYGCLSVSQPLTVYRNNPPEVIIHAELDSNACVTGSGILYTPAHTGYTYEWRQNPPNSIISYDTLINISNPFSYTLRVTDSIGCLDDQLINFDLSTETISFNFTFDQSCQPFEIIYAPVFNGWSYKWFHDGVLLPDTTHQIQTVSTGNYDCLITSPDGCTAYSSTTIFNPVLSVTASLQNNILIASPATTYHQYKWYYNGNPILNAIYSNYTPTLPGNYLVTISDYSGCTEISNVITFPSCSVELHANQIVCDSSCTITLTSVTSGSGNINFIWSTLDTTEHLNNACPGNYVLTIVDSIGCTASDTMEIVVDPIQLSTNRIDPACAGCNDGMIVANVYSPLSSYVLTISPAGVVTGDTITGLAAGTYLLCVTDTIGCTVCDTVTLSDPPVTVQSILSQEPEIVPNPATSAFRLKNLPASKEFLLKIFDSEGRCIKVASERKDIYEISGIEPGLYTILIYIDGRKFTFRLTKI